VLVAARARDSSPVLVAVWATNLAARASLETAVPVPAVTWLAPLVRPVRPVQRAWPARSPTQLT